MHHRIIGLVAAGALAALAACGPPQPSPEAPVPQTQPSVAPSEAPVQNIPFTLEVVNPMPHAMNVSYQWGAGDVTVLGQVDANSTKRFTIQNRGADRIRIVAQDADASHKVTKDVDLDKGEVTTVTLSQ